MCAVLACNLNNAKADSPDYLLYRSERSAGASVCLIPSYVISARQIGDNEIRAVRADQSSVLVEALCFRVLGCKPGVFITALQ